MQIEDVIAAAGRPADQLTRRDVARALLSVPADQERPAIAAAGA